MLVGVPKEIKNHEYRVGLTPSSVNELVKRGHKVIVERNAGAAIDFPDGEYLSAGAEMVESAAEIFARADMVVKIKEPQATECKMLREGQLDDREIEIEARIDAGVLGGAVINAEGLVIDASVRGRLQRLAQSLSQ